ncbi:MAG: hypothetical protein VR68_05925 [Peptococcaceae bacterium BRH_c4a]|nr:MAG: hypothetical protein VR68_05925 [Peptococcaceae bacterium BRH_c4a]
MQINNMLPTLLKILTGRIFQNKADKTSPRQGMDELNRQAAQRPSESPAASASGKIGQVDVKITAQPSPGHNLPDFLPLPLKSPLFTESSFFIKNEREELAEANDGSPANVFIRLRTESMGTLWISLTGKDQLISVSFYTGEHPHTQSIKDSLPELVEELKKLGFSSVQAAGITRPGISGLADIAPGINTSGNYLLDLEV